MKSQPTAKRPRVWRAALLACAVLQAGAGCKKHDDASTRRGSPLPTEAGLTVEVAPATGISVGLDGNKMASEAPFTRFDLEPGDHTLLVRGMGYLPVEMPVTLTAGQTLKVAVSLRARPVEAELPPEPPPPPPRRAAGRSEEPRPAPPPAPPEIGVELPPGVAPVILNVLTQPEVVVTVDDDAGNTNGKSIALHHTYGILTAGPLKIRYSINADRGLEMTLPDDTASWQRDTLDVSAGTVLKFSRGFTRLQRLAADGDQSLILRWTD